MNHVLVPGDVAIDWGPWERREDEIPPEAPVVVRPMTEEERCRYGPPRRPTRAELEQCVAARMDAPAIARKFGVSEDRIQRLLRLRGKCPPRPVEVDEKKEGVEPVEEAARLQAAVPRPELTKEALEAAIAKGMKKNEVREVFGVASSTLYAKQKEWGLFFPRSATFRANRARRMAAEAEKGEVNVEGEEGRSSLTIVRVSEKGDTARISKVLSGTSALVETLGGEFEVVVSLRRVAS